MRKDKNYAFIFARGGSKGIPKKNIKTLAGKPLIQYSIETAQATHSIDEVFVSTDDPEISALARRLGGIVIDRPHELASDTADEWLAWQHAISWVHDEFGAFDKFISLPATSPLRAIQDVDAAIEKYTSENADACISVTKSSRSPYFNMVKHDDSGYVEVINQLDLNIKRRQDAPEAFDVTTVVYVLSPQFILNNKALFDGKVVAVEIPKERAVDIDDIYDFKFAETLLNEQ